MWDPEVGALVEIVNQSFVDPAGPYIQPDIQPYVSTLDGKTVINSRSEHRRYMKTNDLVHLDDFKESHEKARNERYLRKNGLHPEQKRERIRALSDSFEHLRNQARARGRR